MTEPIEAMYRRSRRMQTGVSHSDRPLGPDPVPRRTAALGRPGLVFTARRAASPEGDPLGGSEVPAQSASALARRTGGGSALPDSVASPIGAAMGADLSGVRVHTDAEADRISRSVQATAFTYGQDLYFTQGAYSPGTAGGQHLLAHELAHVAQSQLTPDRHAGAGPSIGHAVDPVEAAADSMAAAALGTLRRTTVAGPAPRSGAMIRRVTPPELAERGTIIEGMAEEAPKAGVNLWVARNKDLDATIHLVGTHHGLLLTDIRNWKGITRYLRDGVFTRVLTETVANTVTGPLDPTAKLIDTIVDRIAFAGKLANVQEGTSAHKIAKARMDAKDSMMNGLMSLWLDDAYAALAMQGLPAKCKGVLEDDKGRAEAREQSARDGALPRPSASPEAQAKINAEDKRVISNGDQSALFAATASTMAQGIDPSATEERNRRWVAGMAVERTDNQVWMIGAAHLPGMIIRLREAGWTVDHHDL